MCVEATDAPYSGGALVRYARARQRTVTSARDTVLNRRIFFTNAPSNIVAYGSAWTPRLSETRCKQAARKDNEITRHARARHWMSCFNNVLISVSRKINARRAAGIFIKPRIHALIITASTIVIIVFRETSSSSYNLVCINYKRTPTVLRARLLRFPFHVREKDRTGGLFTEGTGARIKDLVIALASHVTCVRLRTDGRTGRTRWCHVETRETWRHAYAKARERENRLSGRIAGI